MSDTDIQVMRAADFVDSIGVDTHIPYTDGQYSNASRVSADLAYLGTHEIRDQLTDGANGSAKLSAYIALAQQGQKFTVAVDGGAMTTASVDADLTLAKRVLAAVPGSVIAIEGLNEIGNFGGSFNGQGGQAGALALQEYVYQQVHSDPTFVANGVKVDYFTGYGTTGEGQGPDPSVTPGLADYDTQHSYPNGQAPRIWEEPSTTLPNEPNGAGPHVYTETGYSTAPGTGVSAHDEGAYTGDLLLDAAQTGSTHTDLYELLDAYAPDTANGSSYLGLFDYANNPKPAATLIHDMTTLLQDTGSDASTFATHQVGVTLSGLPSTGHSMQIQKSDGTTDEVVWAEPGTGTTPTPSTVTAALDGKYDVTVYDPLVSTTPIATYTDVSSIQIQVTDHPIIAQLTAATDAGGTTTTPPTTTDPGTGTTTPVTTDPGTGTGTTTTPVTTGGDTGSTTTTPATGTGTTTPVTTDPGTGTTPVTTGSGSAGSTTIGTTTPATGGDTGATTVVAGGGGGVVPPATGGDTGSTTTPPTDTGGSTDTAPAHGLDARTRALFRLDNWIQGHLETGDEHKVAGADALTAALGPDANYRASLRLLVAEDHGQDAQVDFSTFEQRLGVDAHAALVANVRSGLHPDA